MPKGRSRAVLMARVERMETSNTVCFPCHEHPRGATRAADIPVQGSDSLSFVVSFFAHSIARPCRGRCRLVLRPPGCAIDPGGGKCQISALRNPLFACHAIGVTDHSDEAVARDEPLGRDRPAAKSPPASLFAIIPSAHRQPSSAMLRAAIVLRQTTWARRCRHDEVTLVGWNIPDYLELSPSRALSSMDEAHY